LGMLTGWTGRKWDAGPLGAKHHPERIIAHGPINFMCAPAATAASRSRLLLRSKLFVPASKNQFSCVGGPSACRKSNPDKLVV
jgi:hypothetical protein